MTQKDPSEPYRLTPVSVITDKLYKEGFKEEFLLTENGLKAKSSDDIFQSNDIKILKHYRDEGTTDPADMSIVYAIETKTGLKGTIVSGFGPNDSSINLFMKEVEEVPNSNNPNGYKYDGNENTTYS